MLYRPRKVPLVHAFLFDKKDLGTWEYKNLKIEDGALYNVGGYCSCGRPLRDHGVIRTGGLNGVSFICPGTYVMYEGRTITNQMSKETFESIYRPYIDESLVVGEVELDRTEEGEEPSAEEERGQ